MSSVEVATPAAPPVESSILLPKPVVSDGETSSFPQRITDNDTSESPKPAIFPERIPTRNQDKTTRMNAWLDGWGVNSSQSSTDIVDQVVGFLANPEGDLFDLESALILDELCIDRMRLRKPSDVLEVLGSDNAIHYVSVIPPEVDSWNDVLFSAS